MAMKSEPQMLVVGRRTKSKSCDIELPASATTVSRAHLELTITADNRYYIVSLGANKTRVKKGGRWHSLLQDYVEADAQLMLGEYSTTVRDLLELWKPALPTVVRTRRKAPPKPEPAPPKRRRQAWDPNRGSVVWVDDE